ncbi:hypothetical protein U14_01184 [Candidatus Moduliflexus flocculans]|uniref:FeoB-associated Cys-rich membrane protein n=1 Tax=Candidatus Moduliflexus flocculans TaxID=1499966 RepID=A0A0S6VRU7_9BACT|nr:hypothetical protein U14_01184 [Candidatus Moduliflexus flocculans]
MWSIILMALIAAFAAFSIYRHIKQEITGGCSGGCADCAARRNCQTLRKEKR